MVYGTYFALPELNDSCKMEIPTLLGRDTLLRIVTSNLFLNAHTNIGKLTNPGRLLKSIIFNLYVMIFYFYDI